MTKPFRDTTLARIIHRVEQAQAEKAPTERFVDKFARIYTPLVILGSLGVAVTRVIFTVRPPRDQPLPESFP